MGSRHSSVDSSVPSILPPCCHWQKFWKSEIKKDAGKGPFLHKNRRKWTSGRECENNQITWSRKTSWRHKTTFRCNKRNNKKAAPSLNLVRSAIKTLTTITTLRAVGVESEIWEIERHIGEVGKWETDKITKRETEKSTKREKRIPT